MLVGLSAFDLRIPLAGSLKEKRRVVKSLTSGIRQRFNVAVAEVDHQDLWQRATLAVSAVGAQGYQIRKVLHEVERYMERQPEIEVISSHTSLHGHDD